MEEFHRSIEISRKAFDGYFLPKLQSLFSTFGDSRVSEACLYSLEAGGKRIRPSIAINSYAPYLHSVEELIKDKNYEDILLIGASLECLHTYSLIHDDLPSMDNDDLRRGKKTNHIQYDEATAILAGDALNSLGFYLLSLLKQDLRTVKDCFQILHDGVGLPGMISGQMEDLQEEGKAKRSLLAENTDPVDKLLSIHAKKTGALIVSSFLLGNRLRTDFEIRQETVKSYAKEIGLLFQITDDILDVEGESTVIGKTSGKDAKNGKLTYPSVFGLEKAKQLRDESKEKAINLGKQLGETASPFFLGFPEYIAKRKN
ncbi:polyprenyl synthetase family protein [Leptospira ryugenii]|nr:polyprenyl synthetase family protein [Leptospira ryugenii]